MSYTAIVCRLRQVRQHPNADRIKLATVVGNQVVVGLDSHDDDIGVFFPSDGQLSHDMCVRNNLYTRSAMDKLGVAYEPSSTTFGFFDQDRRVRCQRFRGERSDGFWTPLSVLAWTGVDPWMLAEGDTFTALNGIVVCEKYLTAATKRAMARGKGRHMRGSTHWFAKHVDSPQFRHAADAIPVGSLLYVSEKLHGTSGRFGRVLEEQRPSWWQRLLGLHGRREYRYLVGSRNVILSETSGDGFYGTNDFRYRVVSGLDLHKGEILYFEIVGDCDSEWTTDNRLQGRPIMSPQQVKDPDLQKTYGKTMRYRYGTEEGRHELFVYRITRVNDQGIVTELPWPQMRARCNELSIPHVPLLAFAVLDNDQQREAMRQEIDALSEGPSTLDRTHIREGVVVRVERPDGRIDFLKHKSFMFGVLEGYIKDDIEYVDVEEAA